MLIESLEQAAAFSASSPSPTTSDTVYKENTHTLTHTLTQMAHDAPAHTAAAHTEVSPAIEFFVSSASGIPCSIANPIGRRL